MKKTEGLIAAPYTPFDQKGQINTNLIPSYAEYLKKSGVQGVFVNGTTGEGTSLTTEERMICAAEWIKHKGDHFKVIIHVGHNSLPVSIELAAHAENCGADAIGLIAPNFFKPESLSALVSLNAEVAQVAPTLPYYYYHIPALTGANYPMIDFLRLGEEQIPNLAGIKFTHEDLMDMKLCLEYADQKFDILHGRDEILICGMVLGAKGAIGSTYNYISPLFVRILNAIHNTDLTLGNKLQLEAIKIIQVLNKYGGAVKAGKAIMRMVGLDFGNPRLPVIGLSHSEEANLQKELEVIRFFEYSMKFQTVKAE